MISVEQAHQLLQAAVRSLPGVTLPLGSAANLVLAESYCSDIDLPPCDVSSMDGYAARSTDIIGTPLPVSSEVTPGRDPGILPPRSIARIFTGAAIPTGADVVIHQEIANIEADDRVSLESLPPGSNIRRKGKVLRQGELLGEPGDILTPARLALMTMGGVTSVRVHPLPRISIVITGSEFTDTGEPRFSSSIRDSNSPLLASLASNHGFQVVSTRWSSDDLSTVTETLRLATSEADLILTSGGVSVGDWDFVPQAVRDLGGEILYHKVSIKPGKPILAAKIGKSFLLGLPGNPVSVLCGWVLFALPVAQALAGVPSPLPAYSYQAVLEKRVSSDDDRTLFLTSRIRRSMGKIHVTPVDWQGSHDVMAAAKADGFIRLESGIVYEEGTLMDFFPL